MARGGTGNVVPSIVGAEHIGPDATGDNIEAKRVASYVWNGSAWVRATQSGGGGGGTEYTDGDPAPEHPIGGIPVFDDGGTITAVSTANPLPVNAVVTGSAAYSDSGGTDKKGLVDGDRHVQTDVLSSALPSGAATSAKQDTGNASLASIDGKITAVDTGAVVVSSSTLPSGATPQLPLLTPRLQH
jgi:hypothetical protein